MIEILHYTLRTLNYGNYGIFLSMGHAGFLSSTVSCLCIVLITDAIKPFYLGLQGFGVWGSAAGSRALGFLGWLALNSGFLVSELERFGKQEHPTSLHARSVGFPMLSSYKVQNWRSGGMPKVHRRVDSGRSCLQGFVLSSYISKIRAASSNNTYPESPIPLTRGI